MVWASLTLAILIFAVIFAYLLKFHLAIEYASIFNLKATLGFSFLWMRKEVVFDRKPSNSEPVSKAESVILPTTSPQGGFIHLPESLSRRLNKLSNRFRRTFQKFALDPKSWLIVLRYLTRTGFRLLRLLRPSLNSIYIGMEDVLWLGRFAALWSTLCGLCPSLVCPVEYGFNARSAALKLRIRGGFTGLSLIVFVFFALFSFPWMPLGRRFIRSWQNPELNQWQRRLLLF